MDATTRFAELAALEHPPLDEAALLIAAHASPGLDVAAQLRRLDELAARCAPPTLDGLVRLLFTAEGFRGNRQDYYDPANSYLDKVLDRRTGIPISLSVLMIEVGRRAGVPLAPVGLPGHFIVRDKVDPTVFVDPFHGGRLLDAPACRRLYEAVSGGATAGHPGSASFDPVWLAPIGPHVVLARMLANLHVIAEHRGDPVMRLWVLRLRCALPAATAEDRAAFAKASTAFN